MAKGSAVSCHQVSPGAQPFLAVLLHACFPERRVVLVAQGTRMQESFMQDVETWLRSHHDSPDQGALYFPAWEVLPHEDQLPHADVLSERLETLLHLTGQHAGVHRAPIVVTQVSALMQRTFDAGQFPRRFRTLQRNDRIDPLDLVEWLEDQGYEPEVQVNHKGEIALRGGILDIFPLSSPWPVRLEFFGDEIESIRYFDPVSQMSREERQQVTLPPGGELGILKRELSRQPPPQLSSLADYLQHGDILLLPDPELVRQQASDYAEQARKDDPFLASWEQLMASFSEKGIVPVSISPEPPSPQTSPGVIDMSLESLEAVRPVMKRAPDPNVAELQRREFFRQLHRWLRQGRDVHVFCNNDGERQRFREIWDEYGLDTAAPTRKPTPGTGVLHTHLGALTSGFICAQGNAAIVTDAEIFGRYKVLRPRRLKSPHAQTSQSMLDIDFADMEEGDYVVHLTHGIGRYQGLMTVPMGGGNKPLEKAAATEASQECLVIEYAPSSPDQPPPRLYVPVSESFLVSKYVGTGKAEPALHTLGGSRWRKAKAQAEEAVRDLAGELLSIQASRETMAGHPQPTDVPWQRDFESAFLYEETPDQMRAILDTKADLESSKPMDRLICGDVGYGKTEVAIRAAFKTVMSGKQVAVLVPTTVLAQQHFNTLQERMADYPVRVELLSRFRTAKQQQRVLEDLSTGAVDIVVGTHRLIQKDVHFKDLGLVVVDEEQRFGVLHKERFKRMRRLVDVLTLSATPIPRTLYLALTGARDMSTIETPPQDRLPVETIVSEYDERLIRDAIQRELNRQGQVFYLHNRVHDIQNVALRLQRLLPHARIVVGHGQMQADDLETVMTQFVNGDADVLLSTTIIESGLDIPNANTIIIERADRFGLSDLYQLRGRVGRYKHQAYAYLLIPRHARMLTDARKRISAIKQYSTLGSGFKIAMRDLEIRGAGNLLGPQQSGHITAVGFDLYCQLLKKSISQLKGESLPMRLDVQMQLDFLALNPVSPPPPSRAGESKAGRRSKPAAGPAGDHYAYIPADYIADARQRIQIYRKLAEVTGNGDVTRVGGELKDRFGTPPQPVAYLLDVAALKVLAASRNVSSIETREDKLMIMRNNDYLLIGGRFPRMTKKQPGARLKEISRLLKSMSPHG